MLPCDYNDWMLYLKNGWLNEWMLLDVNEFYVLMNVIMWL